MFTPIHLLPRIDSHKSELYQRRWEKDGGPALRHNILQRIRDGAGEDFLQWDYEKGQLGFLESMFDLKGLTIFKEDLTFGEGHGSGWFENMDFSYAQLYHSTFRRAEFNPATFDFTRIFNCEFIECTFSFAWFYGATLERTKFTNCNFVNHNGLTNCDMRQVEFKNCFVPESIFADCRFDANTRVADPINKPHGNWSITLENQELAGIFNGIKEAYSAGGVAKKVRVYFYRQNQAITRHNSDNNWDRLRGYFLEFLTGYGVQPLRVLRALLMLVVIGIAIFSIQVGFENALILATGGFFTFGGYGELLKCLSIWYRLLYILTAFLGIFLTGLYVTVQANVWFRER